MYKGCEYACVEHSIHLCFFYAMRSQFNTSPYLAAINLALTLFKVHQ